MSGTEVKIQSLMRDYFQDDSPWQPIETAPKDGVEILAIDTSGMGEPVYILCKWKNSDRCWVDSFGDDSLVECGYEPLYWATLPTPPKEK
jgi:hypothetical protein